MTPAAARSSRVAVVGDHMLDAYVRGSVDRICPDAPAQVLDAREERFAPGGASNVAAGCAVRGLESVACGFLGDDREAMTLETLLAESGVSLDGLSRLSGRRTLAKRRFCVGDQVLLRVDDGSTDDVAGACVERLDDALSGAEAVIVSDYGYGTMTLPVRERVAVRRARNRALLVIDSKRLHEYRSLAPDVVKPNYRQMLELLGEHPTPDRVRHAARCGQALRRATGARTAMITLDADGCVIVTASRGPEHIPAPPGEVRTTSGAGDTFLSALTAALLEDDDVNRAAELATRSATFACRSETTASDAVRMAGAADRGKRVSPDHLAQWADSMRAEGRTVVVTNGCFDIFHAGHAEYLARAAGYGSALLVAVNTDDGVRSLKGQGRPVNRLEDRLRVLEAIGVIDAVTWFGEPTAADVVAAIRPDVYVKGADYAGARFPEADIARANGGRVVFVDLLEGRSTTNIMQRASSGVAV